MAEETLPPLEPLSPREERDDLGHAGAAPLDEIPDPVLAFRPRKSPPAAARRGEEQQQGTDGSCKMAMSFFSVRCAGCAKGGLPEVFVRQGVLLCAACSRNDAGHLTRILLPKPTSDSAACGFSLEGLSSFQGGQPLPPPNKRARTERPSSAQRLSFSLDESSAGTQDDSLVVVTAPLRKTRYRCPVHTLSSSSSESEDALVLAEEPKANSDIEQCWLLVYMIDLEHAQKDRTVVLGTIEDLQVCLTNVAPEARGHIFMKRSCDFLRQALEVAKTIAKQQRDNTLVDFEKQWSTLLHYVNQAKGTSVC